MSDSYVAADVHDATTTFCVRDGSGVIVMETTVATRANILLMFIKAVPGTVRLTFEEGTHAAWLYELLRPHVAELLVCDPGKNRERGNKSDVIDARRLSEWLRGGFLKPVYHKEHGTGRLKDLVRGRQVAVDDRTRTKNRLKTLFRSRGIGVAGRQVYRLAHRDEWLAKLRSGELRTRATWLYRELDLFDELVDEASAAVLQESRRHRACGLLQTIPGIGVVRSAVLVAEMVTPFRFRTKRQLWSYAGLSVVTRTTADYRVVYDQLVKKARTQTRGLTKRYNRPLKEVFKGAALDALRQGEMRAFYEQRIREGLTEAVARVTLARKLAAIALVLWKKGESYDADKAMRRTT